MNFVRVGGEMHQRALLELKQRRARIAILLVLFPGVAPILVSPGIFQLARRHRQTIHRE